MAHAPDKKLVKQLEVAVREAEREATAASEKSAKAQRKAEQEQERAEVLAAKAIRKREKLVTARAALQDALRGDKPKKAVKKAATAA